VMVIATSTCGIAAALGYRGGLQMVNQITPGGRRAEVVSAFFICCFCGNALPVIGIVSTLAGPITASLIVFSLVALGFGLNYARRCASRNTFMLRCDPGLEPSGQSHMKLVRLKKRKHYPSFPFGRAQRGRRWPKAG